MRERAKRKRGCRCPGCPPLRPVPCHWGNCAEWRCAQCGGLSFSTGPGWCRCDGYARWLRYPGMHNARRHWDQERDRVVVHHAAVKPSLARRFQGGRHNRKRRLYC